MTICTVNGPLSAEIRRGTGQIISLALDGTEFMHPGGRKGVPPNGWSNSEIIMWPIVGPAADDTLWLDDDGSSDRAALVAEYQKRTGREPLRGKVPYHLTQHGIARWLKPHQIYAGTAKAAVEYLYDPSIEVVGEKSPYPLRWPHKTILRKTIELLQDGIVKVDLTVENLDARTQRFQHGWDPSFTRMGEDKEELLYGDRWHAFDELGDDKTWVGAGRMMYRRGMKSVRVEHRFPSSAVWRNGNQVCLEMFTGGMVKDANDVYPAKFVALAPGERYMQTAYLELRRV